MSTQNEILADYYTSIANQTRQVINRYGNRVMYQGDSSLGLRIFDIYEESGIDSRDVDAIRKK